VFEYTVFKRRSAWDQGQRTTVRFSFTGFLDPIQTPRSGLLYVRIAEKAYSVPDLTPASLFGKSFDEVPYTQL